MAQFSTNSYDECLDVSIILCKYKYTVSCLSSYWVAMWRHGQSTWGCWPSSWYDVLNLIYGEQGTCVQSAISVVSLRQSRCAPAARAKLKNTYEIWSWYFYYKKLNGKGHVELGPCHSRRITHSSLPCHFPNHICSLLKNQSQIHMGSHLQDCGGLEWKQPFWDGGTGGQWPRRMLWAAQLPPTLTNQAWFDVAGGGHGWQTLQRDYSLRSPDINVALKEQKKGGDSTQNLPWIYEGQAI